MKYIIVVLVGLFISVNCFAAAGGVSGRISSITVKETGYILIMLQSPHTNPTGCEQDRMIAIAQNHIAKSEIMSVVLSALATDKQVAFWITDCYAAYGTSYPLGITAGIYR